MKSLQNRRVRYLLIGGVGACFRATNYLGRTIGLSAAAAVAGSFCYRYIGFIWAAKLVTFGDKRQGPRIVAFS